MKKHALTLTALVILIVTLVCSCNTNPDMAPPFRLKSMSGVDNYVNILNPGNERYAEVSFPGSSSIVLTVDGVEHSGTYEYQASGKPEAYGHYNFTMNDGSTGSFDIAIFSFDGTWYELEISYDGCLFIFGDNDGFPFDEYETDYAEWKAGIVEELKEKIIVEYQAFLNLDEEARKVHEHFSLGEVKSEDGKFWFLYEDGRKAQLYTDKCYFYNCSSSGISYSDSIYEGKAILTGGISSSAWCAITYIQ